MTNSINNAIKEHAQKISSWRTQILPGFIMLFAGMIMLAGCGKKDTAQSTAPVPTLPPGLLVDAISGETVSVATAIQTAKAGDSILIKGVIGGRPAPFIPERAVFFMTDPAADSSCESACASACPSGAPQIATVQALDETGQPLKISLAGHNGLSAGSPVAVKGKVQMVHGNMLVINAEQISSKHETLNK